MTGKLDLLVEMFCIYFLQDEPTEQLFRNVDTVKKYNMFNSAISVIITNIQNQQLIQTNLDDIIDRHKLYRVNSSHVDNFTNAMTKAVTEIFSNSDPIVKTWLKVIYLALEYFKS